MLDLESKVMDILETEYALEEKIEKSVDENIAMMIERWMRIHDFDSWISDAVEEAMGDTIVSDAIEQAVERYVEDAI